LAAYWSLDEVSGNRADSYGANTLAPVNAPGAVAGVKGNALSVNSAGPQVAQAADNASLSLNGTPFTISGWTRFSALPSVNQAFVTKMGGGTLGYEYGLYLRTDGKLVLGASPDGTIIVWLASTATLSPNTWYHFAVVYDGAQLAIYVNTGAPATVAFSSSGVQNGNNPFQIGTPGGINVTLAVDETAIWKRALTSAEIAWLYNGGLGRSYGEIH
jgi:hypothetical protein